ncbi:glycoside hydrolase family 15 protein [Haladaptatus salinisoli]|uniref:glycoside hydrolase family 15 protein n=1 Tax=Haladaptatus salinisoli TaxID=2884876 RepID=UPI001D0A3A9D|nr:glycoside hydrolase family 15 protein [Haladaptatus salinisoli]
MTRYLPLKRYGIVGNLETSALVSDEGSVDWLPFPHVESPSVFAKILDAEDGGRFQLCPSKPFDSGQSYLVRTNVLRTSFETDSGTVNVLDFMPVWEDGRERALYRKVDGVEGSVDLELAFRPRFDYARAETDVRATDDGVRAAGDGTRLHLAGDASFEVDGATAHATCTVSENETRWFVLRHGEAPDATDEERERTLNETVDYWREWSHDCPSGCIFDGTDHHLAVRSGLVLKLLTHHETGAICAAPTASLPEDVGGVRNWDYRYNWIRDAAFTIQALGNLGHLDEAEAYVEWFLDLCRDVPPEEMQPLYGLHGDPNLEEEVLEGLSGYRGSDPVRIGNAAKDQRQLDVFGELLLAVYETSDGSSFDGDDWGAIRRIVEYVCDVWDEPDSGIWEVRGGPRHFVHSKVMCWVAVDRGLKMADEWMLDAPRARWRDVRAEIRESVLEHGYDDELGSFTQSYDGTALDATGLLIPLVGFLPFEDERVQGTVDAVRDRLETDGLVHRYDGKDGLPGDEGAFVFCSFWLVSVLALSGRVEEAREVYDAVRSHASPLGLLAEEIDPKTERQLGNFPQAFSHVGLVNASVYLKMMEEEEAEAEAEQVGA